MLSKQQQWLFKNSNDLSKRHFVLTLVVANIAVTSVGGDVANVHQNNVVHKEIEPQSTIVVNYSIGLTSTASEIEPVSRDLR